MFNFIKLLNTLVMWVEIKERRCGTDWFGPLGTNLAFQHLFFQNSAAPGEIMLWHAPEWYFGFTCCGICT